MAHKLKCLHCEEEFEAKRSDAKFCSDSCRYITYFLSDKIPKKKYETIYDLQKQLEAHVKEGKRIRKHFETMEEYYGEWSQRVVALTYELERREKIAGISRETLSKDIKEVAQKKKDYNALDDALDFLNQEDDLDI